MPSRALLPMLLTSALLAQSPAPVASPPERWQAVSTTASSVTGNVTFSPDRITFQNGKSLSLAPAGTNPAFQMNRQKVSATLFRITKPDDPVLLGGNRLCGGRTPRPVTFIVVWKHAPFGGDIDPRDMAVFSGDTLPANDDTVCATFSYEAGGHR